jgi:phosphoribosylformylglycinamidine cyclo-ligase
MDIYGEALLDPSVIYVDFVAGCLRDSLRLKYLAHVTGHGWRKLMRLAEPLVYRMTDVGTVPPVFQFIRRAGPVDEKEAYATFNMGVGFAAYVAAADADRCVRIARSAGYTAWVGGTVHRDGGRKAVVIEPLGIEFDGDTLHVR